MSEVSATLVDQADQRHAAEFDLAPRAYGRVRWTPRADRGSRRNGWTTDRAASIHADRVDDGTPNCEPVRRSA